jgi:hypothetical protein
MFAFVITSARPFATNRSCNAVLPPDSGLEQFPDFNVTLLADDQLGGIAAQAGWNACLGILKPIFGRSSKRPFSDTSPSKKNAPLTTHLTFPQRI